MKTRWWSSLADDPGLLGRMRRQWPWVVVTIIVLTGLVLIGLGAWREGAITIGVGMIAAGAFRTVLGRAGIIQIRKNRWLDLAFYYTLGIAIIISAVLVPGL